MNSKLQKRAIIIATLGRFESAGLRLETQCRSLTKSFEIILVKSDCLRRIAIHHGVDPNIFRPDSRGCGFWQWKPLVIHHYCELGYELLAYLDAGCEVNGAALNQLINYFEDQDDFDLLLSRTGHSILHYTKPCVISELLNGNNLSHCLAAIEMLQTGFILLKPHASICSVFAKASEFVRDRRYYLYDDSLEKEADISNVFVDHRHDQSVLNLLLLQHHESYRVGAMHSDLTPPNHLAGWSILPPVIASRNQSSFPRYWLSVILGRTPKAKILIYSVFRLFDCISTLESFPPFLVRLFLNLDIALTKKEAYNLRSMQIFAGAGFISSGFGLDRK